MRPAMKPTTMIHNRPPMLMTMLPFPRTRRSIFA
jgi:hypothetical protein